MKTHVIEFVGRPTDRPAKVRRVDFQSKNSCTPQCVGHHMYVSINGTGKLKIENVHRAAAGRQSINFGARPVVRVKSFDSRDVTIGLCSRTVKRSSVLSSCYARAHEHATSGSFTRGAGARIASTENKAQTGKFHSEDVSASSCGRLTTTNE